MMKYSKCNNKWRLINGLLSQHIMAMNGLNINVYGGIGGGTNNNNGYENAMLSSSTPNAK